MKKHGICDFVPDLPKGKKARKDMVVKVDIDPVDEADVQRQS